jgi:hypothetical protein
MPEASSALDGADGSSWVLAPATTSHLRRPEAEAPGLMPARPYGAAGYIGPMAAMRL